MEQRVAHNKLKNFLYILAGLGGISLVIIIHELGHFLFAHFFGVPTPIFSIGFGPALFSFPIGETVFQIAMLPFGGYVEMDPAALDAQTYLPKMLIISAGILFNFILAYGIILYYTLRNQCIITSTISTVTPNSPAAQVGLRVNDTIIAYDHHAVDTTNIESLLKKIAESADQTITLTIKRNGSTIDIPIQLTTEHPLFGHQTGWLGIELHKDPMHTSFFSAIKSAHSNYTETIKNIGYVTSKIMSRTDKQGTIVGPIGIINIMGKSLAISPQFFWLIMAMISLNIGFFNMLPLPFFDGGKAVIYTIEALTGTTISPTILWYITIIFLALFIFFITKITMQDIKRLGSK